MTIDKQALREVAEKATKGPWKVFSDIDTKTFAIHTPRDKRCENVIKWGGFDCQPNAEANAEFIAAFNPKVALALLDELEAEQGYREGAFVACNRWHDKFREEEAKLEATEKRIAELEREKPLMVDAMHAAVALNSAGINLNDFDNCVSRLHEWGAFPDYCVALYLDYIHDVVSENKLLDFGYISDNGTFSTRQRIAELEARTVNLPKLSVGEVMHMSGFSREYAEGWCAGNDNARHEIRAAGVKIKEE
ncbi:TPA: ead/Ea22-like family protein [Salmonella enterica subsp. enterica serovar Kottbus]